MVLCSPLKLLSRLSCFIDGVNLMDEGGVQFYLDHIVVLHDSGAMLEGREGVREQVERKEGGRREERAWVGRIKGVGRREKKMERREKKMERNGGEKKGGSASDRMVFSTHDLVAIREHWRTTNWSMTQNRRDIRRFQPTKLICQVSKNFASRNVPISDFSSRLRMQPKWIRGVPSIVVSTLKQVAV